MVEPIILINNLRKADEYMSVIFTQGSCYRFHLFLKSIYPGAIPYITEDKQHVVTSIGDEFYDINGYYHGRDLIRMNEEDEQHAKQWSFKKLNLLKLTECPICEEPIPYKPANEFKKQVLNEPHAPTTSGIENLRALVHGEKLNTYQKALAWREFKRLEKKRNKTKKTLLPITKQLANKYGGKWKYIPFQSTWVCDEKRLTACYVAGGGYDIDGNCVDPPGWWPQRLTIYGLETGVEKFSPITQRKQKMK